MFYKHSRFQLLSSPHRHGETYGLLNTSELPLSAADADDPDGLIPIGTMVDAKDNSETIMKLATANAMGFLINDITLLGVSTDAWFKQRTLGGYIHVPKKKGQVASIFRPNPGCEAIFEGAADISGGDDDAIGHLVVKTGTGALSAATAIGAELTCVNGAWRLAAAGEFVLAHMRQANLTPENAGEIRIRVRFCSPYKLVVDTIA